MLRLVMIILMISVLVLSFFISPSFEYSSPKALILPLSLDPTTHQYIIQVKHRTPLAPRNLALHLAGESLWIDCNRYGNSSTIRPVHCFSHECQVYGPLVIGCKPCAATKPQPGCNVFDSCYLKLSSLVNGTGEAGQASADVVSVRSTDGKNPGPYVTIPKVPFACGYLSQLKLRLGKGVTGVAGFGRDTASVPALLSSAFGLPRKFAVCFSNNGVVFVGNGPYVFLPRFDATPNLMYTRLISHPKSTADYYIAVKSIKIGEKQVPLNSSLFQLNKRGTGGGTKISTMERYTVLHSSIYRALLKAFEESLAGVRKLTPVKPFGLCYAESSFGSTRVGPGVQQIILEMTDGAQWYMFGGNSMAYAAGGRLCLAFVDGGAKAEAAIVIGTHQMEDNLVEFDVARSRLGFTSSLLFHQTTCGNFNFTITP